MWVGSRFISGGRENSSIVPPRGPGAGARVALPCNRWYWRLMLLLRATMAGETLGRICLKASEVGSEAAAAPPAAAAAAALCRFHREL